MTGTFALLRLVLRRDRLLLPLWIIVLTAAPMGYLSSIEAAYPDAASRQHFYDLNASSAMFVVRNGPLYGSSVGNLLAWQCGFVPVVAGLIALLTVLRHTRTEEEAGRRELTGATVVGRHACLAAAVIAACGACLAYGVLV
ncbi:ABC transporter permease, partial [Amycolatopsis sp. SID8362]|nr:ABC transporter permease [Amycolatopsis sp. SID8362]NED38502.1 ABC transporter permease [Amycolatopsis sp. SID8362]